MPRLSVLLAPAVIATLLHSAPAHAQTAARPEFEVASVKPSGTCPNQSGDEGPSPGRLNLSCATLRNLIQIAYGAFEGGTLNAKILDVTGGPSWLDSDHWDISAKAEGPASATATLGPMLQTLLEDRFQLKVHKEARDKPVYALTLMKDASKLQPMKDGSCVPIDLDNLPRGNSPGATPPKYCGGGSVQFRQGNLIADVPGATMAEFAGRFLAGNVDRPIVDKTGLTGRYDIHLEFSRDLTPPAPANLGGAEAPNTQSQAPAGPSIFTALQQQLGLKLTPDKAPIEVIVVDRAEKPSAN